MGRYYIPPAVYTLRPMSPLTSLLNGLVDAMPEGHLYFPVADQDCRQTCDATHIFPRWFLGKEGCTRPLPRKPWVQAVNIGNFAPKDISVKVESKAVTVHAKREERNGDDFDLVERKRVVHLPDGIDTKNLACFFGNDGRLFFRAPFADQKAVEKKNPSCQNDSTPAGCCKDASRCCKMPNVVGHDTDTTSSQPTATEAETLPETTQADNPELKGESSTESDDESDVPSLKSLFDETIPAAAEQSEADCEERGTEGDSLVKESEDKSPEKENSPVDLKPLEDAVRRTDDGLSKRFEMSLNMKEFEPENISIRFVDNELCIDARQEIKEDGICAIREVHRKYVVPENGLLDAARANIDSRGYVNVIVPLDSDSDNARTIPIVKTE